jgi:hypothetical protein
MEDMIEMYNAQLAVIKEQRKVEILKKETEEVEKK